MTTPQDMARMSLYAYKANSINSPEVPNGWILQQNRTEGSGEKQLRIN